MNLSTSALRIPESGLRVTPAGRWTSVAGAVYVTAWTVGLFVGPAAPAADAPAAAVHSYFAQSPSAIVLQACLVHGLAGLALAALAVAIPRATGASGLSRLAVTVSALSAALVSLLQLGFAVAATHDVEHSAASSSQAFFEAINVADTIKLVLLAAFVATATHAARCAGSSPRWLRLVAAATVVLLPLGGVAFLVDNPVLTAALYASLPLLLLWAGATAYIVGIRAR